MLSLHESVAIYNQSYNRADAAYQARRRAIPLFRRARSHAAQRRIWSVLTGRRNALRDLSAVTGEVEVKARHHLGVHHVPIARIQGSEGRSRDFDSAFFPTSTHNEERWLGIAAAQLQDLPLPPVDLIQVGDNYYVRDGHHRISVARSFGQKEIEAQVTLWEV